MFGLLRESTSQHRTDTREEFRKREWFDQIIVCTQLESFHTIADAVAGGKKQNGRADFVAPQVGDDIPAVLVRQHDVDDEEIKSDRTRLLQSRFTVNRDVDSQAGFTQSFGQK